MNWRRTIAPLCCFSAFSLLSASSVLAAVPDEYQPNYDEGYSLGYPVGHSSGLVAGQQRGTREGTATGRSDGYKVGWDEMYQPTFDRAYDFRFPIGHAEGWSTGVAEGFEEGFNYAPTLLADMFSNGNNGFNCCWSGVTSGAINISGGSFGSSDITFTDGIDSRDWAEHYYDVGYGDGHELGFSIGSDQGYELTYPAAYEAGQIIGHKLGTKFGRIQGRLDGGEAGFDAGWDTGYDDGFDKGFYAGIDFHLFGEFVAPTNDFVYSNRRSAGTSVPEPATFALVGLAIAFGFVRRWR
jgi:PEP-CTERM motif